MSIERKVLGGLLTAAPEVWEEAARLRSALFPPTIRPIYEILRKHYLRYGECPEPRQIAYHIKDLRAKKDDKQALLREYFDLRKSAPKELKRWDFDRLIMDHEQEQMIQSMQNALMCLGDGVELNGKFHVGLDAARALLFSTQRSAETEVDLDPFDAYQRRKEAKDGIRINLLAELTDVFSPGEEWVLAGYAGDGKTTLLLNLMYELALAEKPALILGMECPPYVTKWKLACMHSLKDKPAIPYSRVKRGRLKEEEEQHFRKLLGAFDGYLNIIDVPAGARMGEVLGLCRSQFYKRHYDLVALDYTGLLAKRGEGYANQLGEIIRGFKEIARTLKTTTLCLHQTNREGWKSAQASGRYSMSALADTNEAERTADGIICILKKEHCQSIVHLLKYRDEAKDLGVKLTLELNPEHFVMTKVETSAFADVGAPSEKQKGGKSGAGWSGHLPIGDDDK